MSYEPFHENAGPALREARRRAGLTQSQLAELAETSQSAVAAYESGARQPTLPVLSRMIRATGHLMRLRVETDPRPFRLSDLAYRIRETAPDEPRQLRLVFEFLRGIQDDDHPLMLLVAAEPEGTGDRRFDALLAAVAEDLCVRAGLAPPGWVHAPSRFLDRAWWVSDLPSGRAQALVHSPASFRRRGIMLARHDMQAA